MRNPRIGILGGGQLARMLALSAHPLGIDVKILTPNADDPAAQVCRDVQVGALNDHDQLRTFLTDLDYLTFESEFADTDLVESHLPSPVRVFPSLKVIETIQDRLTQKHLLDRFKIPSSEWLPVDGEDDLRKAAQKFTKGFVLKQRRFGYDGYGTFVYQPGGNLDLSPLQKSRFGFIAEEFIAFKRELAISFVRSSSAFVVLPLVESVQVNSRCFSVNGPVKHAKLPNLIKSIKRMMDETDYHGILAVEMFDTGSELSVNELAPRVHNSAHYSQNAMSCSQFEYHLRAGMDWPLPAPQLFEPGFAMVNLLGEGNAGINLPRSTEGHLHWYGKADNRAGRKLGHINVIGKTPEAALERALKWRKDFDL